MDGPPPADPCVLVIFGGTGDLTRRKLLPALLNLAEDRLLPERFAVLAVSSAPLSEEAYGAEMDRSLREHATGPSEPGVCDDLVRRLHHLTGDLQDPATYRALAERLEVLDAAQQTEGNVLFYLAVPPSLFVPALERLGEAGLLAEREGWRRIVVEKPFGRDYESAVALNAAIRKVLDESQVFRIDHYLGKETVQNLLVFRFAIGIFEPICIRRYVDHVQITV
ncbi:MAG: glucose-6-phosphate dehydrogenase, partial [Thermoanaerobaculia bacterium]